MVARWNKFFNQQQSQKQMSNDKQSSSTIIFEQEEEVQIRSPRNPGNPGGSLESKESTVAKQISTNLIRVESKTKMKRRIKAIIKETSNFQQLQIKFDEHASEPANGNDPQDEESQCKSETSSNKQTKPTKTIEEHENQEDVQPSFNQFPTGDSLWHRPFYGKKLEQLPSETLHPHGQSDRKEVSSEDGEIEQGSESESSGSVKEEATSSRKVGLPVELKFSRDKLEEFIRAPIQPGYQMNCSIEIEEGFLGFVNKYHMRQQSESKVLISAKKQVVSLTPKIILSLSKQNHSRRNQYFVGILQSNFSGTSWSLSCPAGTTHSPLQTEICARYSSSIMGSKSVREMKVALADPRLPKKEKARVELSSAVKLENRKKLIELRSAKPVLERGKYHLDFKGVAKMASNKNLMLCNELGQSCLILGMQGAKTYRMNIKYPLSLIQGFSLCLASLESKIMVN